MTNSVWEWASFGIADPVPALSEGRFSREPPQEALHGPGEAPGHRRGSSRSGPGRQRAARDQTWELGRGKPLVLEPGPARPLSPQAQPVLRPASDTAGADTAGTDIARTDTAGTSLGHRWDRHHSDRHRSARQRSALLPPRGRGRHCHPRPGRRCPRALAPPARLGPAELPGRSERSNRSPLKD